MSSSLPLGPTVPTSLVPLQARMVMEAKIDLATGQQQNIEETEFGEVGKAGSVAMHT